MEFFVLKPILDRYSGIRVTKETELEFANDTVTQTLKGLVLHTVQKLTGEGYEGIYDVTLTLAEGDVLIFEEEGRGYIKPAHQQFVSVEEAIADLSCVKDMG